MAERVRVVNKAWPWGFVFFMAYVGAAIYFIGHSNGSFWSVILGLLQALIWPVYATYHVLELMHV